MRKLRWAGLVASMGGVLVILTCPFQSGVNAATTQPRSALTSQPRKQLSNAAKQSSRVKNYSVWIIADGAKRQVEVSGTTVAEALAAANVTLGQQDKVTPPLKYSLRDALCIRVVRVEVREQITRKPVPRGVQIRFVNKNELCATKSQVEDEGEDGIVEERLKVVLRNGSSIHRQVVSRRVVKLARPRVIVLSGRGGFASRGLAYGRRLLTMVATAYDPGPRSNGRYAGRTATGIRARYGVAAVDPRVIPLGTRLYVEGYGYALAADTGSAIKGMRIDLCFNTRAEAIRYGIKKVRVLVLE